MMLVLPIITSALAGIPLLISSFADHLREKKQKSEKKASGKLRLYVGSFVLLSAVLALAAAWGESGQVILFPLTDRIPIAFRADGISRFFLIVTSIVWTAVCFYSFKYMEHEGEEKRFYGFYLLAYGALVALDFSANLITFYFFYEWMTLLTMPLVIGRGTREKVMAALKYLFYSLAGAYLALFGIFFLNRYCDSLSFRAGGTLNGALAVQNRGTLLAAVFLMLIGFGAKSGMFPLHAWLPTAHPAAPSPASAALSGIIVKSGVLAVIRTVYYIVGPDFLRGTWVQSAWIILTLTTVFMGSLLAFRERVFKKRLAYSTVSQVSYILLGLALLNPEAFSGALLHTAGHAFAKCALFMVAGIFILRTGKTRVEEYAGIGKQRKKTLWAYTLASLSLIGIPPMAGFVSKWYLAQGALSAGLGFLSYACPAALLISALLTAGYLLPIAMRGFFPGTTGENREAEETKEAEKWDMMVAMPLLLAALTVIVGLFPNGILEYVNSLCADIM